MQEITINVKTKDEHYKYWLDGKWTVGFTTDRDDNGKWITFCAIRQAVSRPCYAGCTYCNPRDIFDYDKGEREAFKRAVSAMFNSYYFLFPTNSDERQEHEKRLLSRFRGALRNAKLQLEVKNDG